MIRSRDPLDEVWTGNQESLFTDSYYHLMAFWFIIGIARYVVLGRINYAIKLAD